MLNKNVRWTSRGTGGRPGVSKAALCEIYIKSSPKLRKAQLCRHTNVTRYRVTLKRNLDCQLERNSCFYF